MIGIGKFDLAVQSIGYEEAKKEKNRTSTLYKRSGYLWMSGIAAQTRLGRIESGAEAPDDDLNSTKGVAFDFPGIWTEISYHTLYFNVVSVDYLFGLQMGKHKYIAYATIGVGFWY